MSRRFRFPVPPTIHFMAAAPLDAWVRLLLTPGARVGWRYWPRMALNVGLSACVTAMTLPERLALAPVLWWTGRRSGWRVGHPPPVAALSDGGRAGRGVSDGQERRETHPSPRPSPHSAEPERGEGGRPPTLVILGYYRTGTTHLHNLLACDPASHTPRWGQVLAPQGFVVSWFVLMLFLWAVLPTKRPQDDVAFGPEWPGEDDFALSNWTLASPLCGRVVLPNCYEHFRRFHDLEGLTARERERWRRTQWATVWKIGLLGRGRRLLLKTPPHTARVPALTDVLGGPGRVKFIHLSREAGAVLKSNERLMKAMTAFHLQDGPGEEIIRERLVAEYEATEKKFEADSASILAGDLVRMRYEDLIADPMGELKRAYAGLGLEWTAKFEQPLGAYLESVREYRSETQKLAGGSDPAGSSTSEGGSGHPAHASPKKATRAERALTLLQGIAPGIVGITGLAIWVGVAWWTGHRSAIFAWLLGIAVGHAATRRAPGSVKTGLLCANLSLLLTWMGMTGTTRFVDFAHASSLVQAEIRTAVWRHLTHESTLLWTALGVVSAFRLGSRRFGTVPGR